METVDTKVTVVIDSDQCGDSINSSYQLNLSEAHSTLTVYTGWDYTEYSSLVHVPLRPPSDYYTLTDILANGHSLDGATANILAAIRTVSYTY